jgi:hypothetical protein
MAQISGLHLIPTSNMAQKPNARKPEGLNQRNSASLD